jgi:hypothetical protein
VRPKEIGLAGIGLRRAGRKATIVSFEGHEFAIGHGAWSKGEPLTSMDYGALASTERLALFYGAVTPLLQPGHYDNTTLVVGLPVPLLQDAEQAKVVLEASRPLTFSTTPLTSPKFSPKRQTHKNRGR